MRNEQLYVIVKQICLDIIRSFEADGHDLSSREFLSSFPYMFLGLGIGPEALERRRLVLESALSEPFRKTAEETIEAAYSHHYGGDLEHNVADAVDDFLNFVIPRMAGLNEQGLVFERHYKTFDESFYGEKCVVTTFSVLENVWDNGLRAVLPPGFRLSYYTSTPGARPSNLFMRERLVPYFEISRSARSIEDQLSYFVFSYTTTLNKSKNMLSQLYRLRDEITRKFVFATRLLIAVPVFSDYRGFRTIGHLSAYQMNLMNFPEDVIDRRESRELSELDGHRLRRLLPKLVELPYDTIAVLDRKIEDALARRRYGSDHKKDQKLRVAVDRLLDYFQVLEAIVPVAGSEFISLYTAVLHKAIDNKQDAEESYQFVKRMHSIRNDVMHGRIQDVIAKDKLSIEDIHRFSEIIHALSGSFVMNGPLRDQARALALGKTCSLISVTPGTAGEMNEMRKPQEHPPAWWS